jgi:hypothetical protein
MPYVASFRQQIRSPKRLLVVSAERPSTKGRMAHHW